jgi:hypothetical protein
VSPSSRALLILVVASTAAHAESKQAEAPAPRPWTGYIRVPGAARPAPAPGTSSVASSKIAFIKRCIGGCDVHYDPVDDSRTGASSIAAQGSIRTIGEFTQPLSVWNDMMACVRATFAPFDITITDVKPSDGTTPHFLNIVGGKPTDLHPNYGNAGGVAPFDCGEIPNAISYTFDVYGPRAEHLCWTVSQEVAHAFGLEHEFLAKDPMTYLGGDMPKRFRDIDAPCGELEQLTRCECGGSTQNTYRHIVEMFGPGAPTPPAMTIDYPPDGKKTQPGFTAVATAIDDVRVERVELLIDGVLVATSTTPFGDSFELPTTDAGAGPHTLEVKATDVQGVVATQTISFTQGPPCTPDTECEGAEVCVSGLCIPGPGTPGGLGSVCQTDLECLSHRCVDGGEEFKHCVDECDVANAASCPDDFACVAAGAEGVCWPAASGGCCDAGAGPQGPILLALGLGVLVLRRRRRATS